MSPHHIPLLLACVSKPEPLSSGLWAPLTRWQLSCGCRGTRRVALLTCSLLGTQAACLVLSWHSSCRLQVAEPA